MIMNKVQQLVLKIFALLYKHIYLRYLYYFRPGKLEHDFGEILDVMRDCNSCTNPKEVPDNDSMVEHVCDKHMKQIEKGELGNIL